MTSANTIVPIPIWLEEWFHAIADRAIAAWPRSPPTQRQILECRVVAHRGAHDQDTIENTFMAFDRALELGAWGIEFDVRWTKDNVAIVLHDRDCRRVFASPLVVVDTEFARLKRAIPEIPSLEDVVTRYGQRAHLMIELKGQSTRMPQAQLDELSRLLAPLAAKIDFHLLADEVEALESLEFVSQDAKLALARVDTRRKSQFALEHGYDGILGHYALLSNALIARHISAGQTVGTGFVASRNSFYREVSRGVKWLFTNSCHEMTSLRQVLIDQGDE